MTYSEEAVPVKSKREEIGYGRNKDAEVDVWKIGLEIKELRGTTIAVEISKKRQETRLRWYGHIMKSDGESNERKMMDMEVYMDGEEDRK